MDLAEIEKNHKLLNVGIDRQKCDNETDRVLIDKIKALDQVLCSYSLDGKDEARDFIPILNPDQRKIVTTKLLTLIEKL